MDICNEYLYYNNVNVTETKNYKFSIRAATGISYAAKVKVHITSDDTTIAFESQIQANPTQDWHAFAIFEHHLELTKGIEAFLAIGKNILNLKLRTIGKKLKNDNVR